MVGHIQLAGCARTFCGHGPRQLVEFAYSLRTDLHSESQSPAATAPLLMHLHTAGSA
ncbi:hypothetical protein FOMPIDRAFT_1023293 [Fomitopsis schrenkii]|uniref:Uncharacterized protein n=1 Tax=Fomitopsis schrenkii TaxID=2126942 RepID=S8FIY5_FOMSC|nr:hypothetical protein FOMPIDRAFT_1023293 [Fomitopsis schrenkii]